MKTKAIILLILLAPAFFSCKSSNKNIEKKPSIEQWDYETAWGIKERMIVDPQFPRHNYDFKKLKYDEETQRFTYKDKNYKILHGIDISRHEKEIDWDKVCEDGIEFVVIRMAYRRYGKKGDLVLDENFRINLKNAREHKLPVGVYVFSQAINEKEAKEEAQIIIDNIKPEELELPVFFDPESIRDDEARSDPVSGEQFTKNAIVFCEKIKEAGFTPMIYANMTWQNVFFDMGKLKDYQFWFADYEEIPQTPYDFVFWQYTAYGKVNGISTFVDRDIMFVPVIDNGK